MDGDCSVRKGSSARQIFRIFICKIKTLLVQELDGLVEVLVDVLVLRVVDLSKEGHGLVDVGASELEHVATRAEHAGGARFGLGHSRVEAEKVFGLLSGVFTELVEVPLLAVGDGNGAGERLRAVVPLPVL